MTDAQNPLINIIDWSPQPQGTVSVNPPIGADYLLHENFLLYGLTTVIDWGFKPAGSTGTVVTRHAAGWPGRRTIKREEFERRLKEQRDNTFGRRRWAELKELEAAEEAASRLALETESKAQRKALEAAAQAARTAAREIESANVLPAPEVAALTLSLQAATGAARIKASLDEAKVALGLAAAVMAAIRRAEDEAAEEEEAIELLSLLS